LILIGIVILLSILLTVVIVILCTKSEDGEAVFEETIIQESQDQLSDPNNGTTQYEEGKEPLIQDYYFPRVEDVDIRSTS